MNKIGAITRAVNISRGFRTDSSAANDTQYRICSDGTFKNGVSDGYREVSIDTPIESDILLV